MAVTFCNRCGDAVLEEGCDLWDELAELDALLDRLTIKRYELKRRINQLRSPIVRQLPPDVTSTIFEFCLPDFEDRGICPNSREDLSIPLSLGAICSYWRDVAWSMPSLWSSLVVRVPNKLDPHTVTGIAQEWLARSGHLPLSIRIMILSTSHWHDNAVSALGDIINQYSARWSNLDLCIPDYYYQHFHATNNHAPILKSIRFHFLDDMRNVNFQPLTCPRLERAILSFFPRPGGIELEYLTHLTLYSITIIDSFLILRTTPRLVFCEISGYCLEGREPSTGALVLPSLRSLRLLISSFAEYFLNNLTAPHLEEFELPAYYNPSMEVIASFLKRSACSLRSFTMIFSIFPPYFERFMSLLQSMPSLNSLSLLSITRTLEDFTAEEYDPRNILQFVAKVLSSQSASRQQGFLPNLKILKYTGELYLRPGNYGDLYSLPPADNAVHGPLHLLKLNLYPATRVPKNVISYVTSLRERGVTVNVLSSSEDILQSSIDYCRRREDWCGDWADNLVLSLFSWLLLWVISNCKSRGKCMLPWSTIIMTHLRCKRQYVNKKWITTHRLGFRLRVSRLFTTRVNAKNILVESTGCHTNICGFREASTLGNYMKSVLIFEDEVQYVVKEKGLWELARTTQIRARMLNQDHC